MVFLLLYLLVLVCLRWSYYERPNSQKAELVRPKFQKAEKLIRLWDIWVRKMYHFSLFFKAENEIRPFKLFGLLSFNKNSAFTFLIFCLIFRHFKFLSLMVSALCDFGLPYRARLRFERKLSKTIRKNIRHNSALIILKIT